MRRMGGRGGAPRRAARRWAPLLAALVAACATGPVLTPLEDPLEAGRTSQRVTSPDRPYHVTFTWEYADERGAVEGEGVLRFTPPGSLRLDLFSTGDASMAVALVPGSDLRVAGQIRDVRLPPPAFLYASAGLLRPGAERPTEAYAVEEGGMLLVYPGADGGTLRFRLRSERLREVEERREGSAVRRTRLSWPDSAGAWPSRAEYRDVVAGRRARWNVQRARVPEEPFDPEIYDLPPAP